ncbi:hypothetical protein AWB81_00547 [Caballeronia arationis]|jgi:hypothetical protein|uniref:Uncharacterized protein n=1 Tax=Caballeronia arationis TaxID=1777142 RepID=A0A7Z7N1C9_9BURK|nr:hypothetical protein [Caballeronia arationis]SAK47037.1 hypothetical protein AWB81_00547 [Caballeronia arationis]SOE59039.1 hypothetical protein SAMN05446927_1685 [Caballeronia arationis]
MSTPPEYTPLDPDPDELLDPDASPNPDDPDLPDGPDSILLFTPGASARI